jgi:hypothetical protein
VKALLLAVAAAALAGPAAGAGGLALHGAGLGTYASNDGSQVCADSPFVVEVLYLPDGRGAMHSEFAGGGACLGLVGLTAVLGGARVDTLQSPPVELVFFCTGSEAAGLHCEGEAQGVPLTADVGPYGGPLGAMTLSTRGAFMFDGVFTAV